MSLHHEPDGTLHGADDIDASLVIDLSDLDLRHVFDEDNENPVSCQIIGIELEKVGPKEGNLFGYWPMITIEGGASNEYVTDDFFASLPTLCEEYDLPLDIIIDRIALELLRRTITV